MFLVVGDLDITAAIGLVDGLVHGFGDVVRIHDDGSGHISRGATNRLDEGTVGTQETFLIGVKNRDQRHFRQIKTLTQQVDADNDVDFAFAQFAQQFDTSQGVHIGMQVFDFNATLQKIIGKIFGHLLGQRSHQRTFITSHTILDFSKQIIDLPVNRTHIDLRINQSRRSDDLFDHTITQTKFIIARCGGKINRLADAFKEFRPFEWTIIHCRRQTEPVFHQRALTAGVTLIHGANLRHGNMRFIDDQQKIVGEKVKQRVRRTSRLSTVEMPRIILHSRADANLREHLQIVCGTHGKTLRLKFLALFAQFGGTLVKFLLNGRQCSLHTLRPCHIVRCRKNMDLRLMPNHISGKWMQG